MLEEPPKTIVARNAKEHMMYNGGRLIGASSHPLAYLKFQGKPLTNVMVICNGV